MRALFTAPGIYTFTLQVTDLANQTTTVTRQVTAFNVADFEAFDSPLLAPNLVAQNIEARDNYSPTSWYSLADEPGTLRVQVLSDAPKPLNGALGHPFVSRILPVTADWALQTEFGLLTRQFGSFNAGLLVELSEGGQTVRYVLSLDGGLNVTVLRGVGAADYPPPLATLASTGSGATLRVRRVGATLLFEREIADIWTEVHTVALPPDATALRGGVFVATSTAQSVAVEFDYLLLSDPGNSTNLVDHLRITEIMYNSSAVGGVEFIELTNTGNSPLELQGAYFEDSRPFDQFVFQAMTLQPRAFVVVTNDIDAFRNLYGNNTTIAGQFTGALNNNGERIVLKDAQGNTIQDFTYGTNALWPAKANGGGSSLEILLTTGNYNDPANWREGVEANGSPGVLGVGYDGDGDGQPDRVEVVVGTNPSDPNSIFRVTQVSVNASGHVTITWPSAPGVSYQVEFKSEAAANGWQFLTTVPGGGSTTSFTDTSAAGQPNRFYRVTVP